MPTVRQQRALVRADQDFGSGCSPFGTAMSSRCLLGLVLLQARASRPTTSRSHRRVERAATVALPRLFWFSLLLQARAPQAAPLQATFVRSGAFWTWWPAFRGARLRGDLSDDDLSSSPSPKPGAGNREVSNSSFTARASVGTDSARRESYQQRSTTAKTQARRRAATKVAS